MLQLSLPFSLSRKIGLDKFYFPPRNSQLEENLKVFVQKPAGGVCVLAEPISGGSYLCHLVFEEFVKLGYEVEYIAENCTQDFQQSQAEVVILDDFEELVTEENMQMYLYDLLNAVLYGKKACFFLTKVSLAHWEGKLSQDLYTRLQLIPEFCLKALADEEILAMLQRHFGVEEFVEDEKKHIQRQLKKLGLKNYLSILNSQGTHGNYN